MNAEEFGSAIQDNNIVVVDFWAAWCGPCRAFASIYDEVSASHTDVVFAKVDTEAEPGLASSLEISSIPTVMVFREGVLVYRRSGVLPQGALNQVVNRVKDLDLNEIARTR